MESDAWNKEALEVSRLRELERGFGRVTTEFVLELGVGDLILV